MVLYEGDTWRRPSSGLGVLPFVPGIDFSLEYDCTAGSLHPDVARIQAGVTTKGIFYLRFDIGGCRLRLQCDVVGQAFHSAQMSDCSLSSLSLKPEIHLPTERDPAIVDSQFDARSRDEDVCT